MAEGPRLTKIPLVFFRTAAGSEPVRQWLKDLPQAERRAIGKDLLRAQWRWPIGMPLCRPLGDGLREIRTDLPTKRTARVLLSVYPRTARGEGDRHLLLRGFRKRSQSPAVLVALHGFIKKSRTTPDEDLALARKRKKELEQ